MNRKCSCHQVVTIFCLVVSGSGVSQSAEFRVSTAAGTPHLQSVTTHYCLGGWCLEIWVASVWNTTTDLSSREAMTEILLHCSYRVGVGRLLAVLHVHTQKRSCSWFVVRLTARTKIVDCLARRWRVDLNRPWVHTTFFWLGVSLGGRSCS